MRNAGKCVVFWVEIPFIEGTKLKRQFGGYPEINQVCVEIPFIEGTKLKHALTKTLLASTSRNPFY